MQELFDTLDQIQGQELQNLIVLLKNVGRITAAGTFLLAVAHLYVLYACAGSKKHTVHRSGMVFLIFAVLVWLGMASSKLFLDVNPGDLSLFFFFSTFNNSFLIASLPFIGHGFLWIRKVRLFRNRLVWVISALIFCMAVSLLLLLSSKVAPDFSKIVEIAFSMLSMSLFGYAALTSFRSSGANVGTLLIVAIAPIGYALLQVILNHIPADHEARFWVFRTVAVVVANSAITGMFLLTSANMILGNLEQALASTKTKLDNREEQHLLLVAENKTLLAEAQALREIVLEKDRILEAMQAEAGSLPDSVYLHRIRIGFEGSSMDKYVVDLVLVMGNEEVQVRCANSKLTVPHAHWIIFALARKKGVTLRHTDIAQAKFQMIKYLNAYTGKHKIMQEHVFRNNGGAFDLSIDHDSISFEGMDQYANHLQLLETFKKYWQGFGIAGGNKSSHEAAQEALITLMGSV